MILMSMLLFTLIILVAVVGTAIAVGGASFIIIFGDVIVCMAIIIWIVKCLIKRRKK